MQAKIGQLAPENDFLAGALGRIDGPSANRKHVRTLMGKMGIAACTASPGPAQRTPVHPIYPYLLKSVVVDRPNQALGKRLDLHPDEARIRLPWSRSSTGPPGGSWPTGSRSA